ncbi:MULTISPECIES: non-oxidative hydroxyarylic acid decarboxylases subunit C [Bacillus]|uniref:non-oxidative hydroxyarylic acid decarboxylases subunit C n=1 Tax=Bacillus TaxID=1386 RepID=UPI000BA77000|nr:MULTISPECIES: non-oxidative hydroxyarylic acid decarboxylases subunit C [Bacillus]MBG9815777.1 phenolic acid decarboxylase [Bacillus safensis]MCY7674021.1 UbiD family decarboxylase [Bacillus safensis]MCY7697020.1 UbiD family decarboxylase [Bacillus safensis]MEB2271122.1 UbiD family decarboxylase [Bacillus safensis]MEC3626577.1 non-oxidative hydroxyarylic acid decarboxylases subunit C [Bacillus safensis]
MSYRDLREFLDLLESENQLVRIKDEVMPEPDLSAIGRSAPDMENAPAVLVEKVKGYKTPVVLNVHGSWQNHALMLNMDKDTPVKEQFFELERIWDRFPIKPVWVDKKDAPVKEVVIEEDINLFDVLPLFRINEFDAGFYISKALVVSKDPNKPESYEEQNAGTYRIQVKGKDKVGIQPLPFHDIAVHLKHAEEKNEPLPIAICLGNDPVLSFMASTPIEYAQSEYDFAGALKGEPIELTKSEHGHLDIPARSEVVLEGYIMPREREIEGPFGEFPGSYSGARLQPIVKITKITHRQNPIFENLYLGMPWTEIDYLMALNTSLPLYKQLKRDFPEVEAVNAMYTHGIGTIVSTKSRLGGYGKAVAMRLLSTPHGMPYTKIAIIVDEFVDPFNLEQVMWALTTRVRPDKDVFKIPYAPGMPLDPSSDPAGMHTKLVIDATTPIAPDIARDTELLATPEKADEWSAILRDLMKKGGNK